MGDLLATLRAARLRRRPEERCDRCGTPRAVLVPTPGEAGTKYVCVTCRNTDRRLHPPETDPLPIRERMEGHRVDLPWWLDPAEE